MEPEEKAAKEIIEIIEANYKPEHEYIAVDEKNYRHLDLRYYRSIQKDLEKEGFRYIEDIENITLRNSPGNVFLPVMIRTMISSDGAISAGIYHPKAKLWLRVVLFLTRKSLGKVVDLETEMNDGVFLVTSNAESASAMDSPPLIKAKYFSKNTPLSILLSYHRNSMKEYIREHSSASYTRLEAIEDIRKSQNRMNAIKAAFRGEIGGIGKDELLKIGGAGRKMIEDVYVEIEKYKSQRQSQQGSGGDA